MLQFLHVKKGAGSESRVAFSTHLKGSKYGLLSHHLYLLAAQ